MAQWKGFGAAGALALASLVIGCGSTPPPARVHAVHAGPIRSRDVARGRHTFLTLCTVCHAGRVNPAGYHWSAEQMRHQIREGNALMPALPPHRLPDDAVEAVLAYLSTIGAIDGELPEVDYEAEYGDFLADDVEDGSYEGSQEDDDEHAEEVAEPRGEEDVAVPPRDRADLLANPTEER